MSISIPYLKDLINFKEQTIEYWEGEKNKGTFPPRYTDKYIDTSIRLFKKEIEEIENDIKTLEREP